MLKEDLSRLKIKNRRVLIELIAILNYLADNNNDSLQRKINFIKSIHLDVLEKVFLTPSGRQWIFITYAFIKNDQIGKALLENYSDWLGISSRNLEKQLIKKLDEFIFSLIITSRQVPDFIFSLDANSEIFFREIHGYWKLNDHDEIYITPETIIEYQIDHNVLTLSLSGKNIQELSFSKLPGSSKFPLFIDLHSEASRASFNGREQLPRVSKNDFNIIRNQIAIVEHALKYIEDVDESIYKYFKEHPNYFVPLIGPEGSLPSSSNSSIDTMFWYSITDQPLLVSEMIIHELSHQRLFRLQDEDPLIDSESYGSGWNECNYYSPWRDDPRPINGVFHGFIVFSEVSTFWLKLIMRNRLDEKDRNIAERRMTMLGFQLSLAKDTLNECRFTSKGEKLLEEYTWNLQERILPFIKNHNLGEMQPFFMEFHDQNELVLGQSISEIVQDHRKQWLLRNG